MATGTLLSIEAKPMFSGDRRGVDFLDQSDVNLLRAALLDGDSAIECFRAWRNGLDWEAMSAIWQRIIPILDANLSRLGVADPLLQRLRGLRRYFWAQNLRHSEATRAVFAAFAADGIPAIALKGMGLVASGYVHQSVRPMDDVDILVQPQMLNQAVESLSALGFEPAWLSRRRFFQRVVPRSGLPGWNFRNATTGAEVDLHWHSMRLDQRNDADELAWQASREIHFAGTRFRVLAGPDQLLRIVAHAVQDGDKRGARWIADAVAIVRGGLDWKAFVDAARRHRLSACSARLLGVVNVVVENIVPPAVLAELTNQASSDEKWEMRQLLSSRPGGRLKPYWKRLILFRRRDDRRFDRSLLVSAPAYLKSATGTRSLWHGLLRAGFAAAGRPRGLRRLMAADRHLALSAPTLLPAWGSSLDVPDESVPEAAFAYGWSVEETEGRWTDGPVATMAWRAAGANPQQATLFGMPALHEAHPKITISCFIDDISVGSFGFALGRPLLPMLLRIPQRMLRGPVVTLSLEVERPFVPADHQVSIDSRPLGFLLKRVRFS